MYRTRSSHSGRPFHRILIGTCLMAAALTACGDSSGSPEATRSETIVDPTVAEASTTTAAPTTTAPTTTVAPTLPPTTEAPPTTAAPTTAAPTTAPPTTAPAPVSTRPIAAIDANGDAVLVAADGSTTLLFDGEDPDDVVEEGPVVLVDTVAVATDGSFALVSECCEPSPGVTFRLDPAVGPASVGEGTFGHGPALSPDGTLVASVAVDSVLVDQLVDGGSTSLATATPVAYPDQVVWANDGRIVLLNWSSTGSTLRAIDITFAGIMTEGPTGPVSDVPVGPEAYTLAGRGDGVVYVADAASPIVRAFDSTTLAPVPAADVILADTPLSVWIEDGEVRWVDTARALHVGATIIPGSYVWVR